MRFTSIVSVLFFGLVASFAMAGLVATSRPVTLSESQRTAVVKVACANAPEKRAIGAQGFRDIMRRHHVLGARVQCDDGIEVDDYRAYFERTCIRRWLRWTCAEPQVRLYMKVAGGGPYEIRLSEVSLEDAVGGMSCLTIALAQNPQVLDGGKAEHLLRVSAVELKPVLLSAYLEAHNECYWVQYPRQCSANAGEQLPVSIDSGCIDE